MLFVFFDNILQET